MDTIRVVLADEHAGVRAGLSSLLTLDGSGIEVVGEAASGLEAIQLSQRLSPEVLLLDIKLPDMEGSEVAWLLKDEKSPVHILAISAYFGRPEVKPIPALLESGVTGCITKDEVIELLVPALQRVARGERWLSPMVRSLLSKGSETEPAT